MHFQHKKTQQKRVFLTLLCRTANMTEFLKWINFFKQYQIHWLNKEKQMLAFPFHIEFQRTDDFSLEVRAGECIFPLTLQDFHKRFFKELFISWLAFLQLLSLIWTLSFAHIFFYSCLSFYYSTNCFFLSGGWVHFNLSFTWWPQKVQESDLFVYHSNFMPVQFLLKRLESKTTVVQTNYRFVCSTENHSSI